MALSAGALAGYEDPAVVVVVVLSAVATVPLAVFGLLAYRRRRSRSYLFVATAFFLFLLKSVLGGVSIVGGFNLSLHHFLEHGLDFAIATFLLIAVYTSRSVDQLDVFSVEETEE